MSVPRALEFIAQRDDVYPDLKIGPGGNVMVQDDGDGPYIKTWPKEYGAKPTAAELTAVTESEAFETWVAESGENRQKAREIVAEMPAESAAEALAAVIEMVDYLAKGGLYALLPTAKKQTWAAVDAKAGRVNAIKERSPEKGEAESNRRKNSV